MTAVARMMQSMGMGSISSMMGLDGRGGTGFIQPASAHDTPSELVSLILRPHGGGMPMGMAGDFLGKIGMGALSYCDADQWDALSGYGALSDYVAKGREREVVTALAARPVAIPRSRQIALDLAGSWLSRAAAWGIQRDKRRFNRIWVGSGAPLTLVCPARGCATGPTQSAQIFPDPARSRSISLDPGRPERRRGGSSETSLDPIESGSDLAPL